MEKRPLGRSGLRIAPLVLGGNVFGWTIDQPSSFEILDAFLDAGFNLVDTADVYSRWAPGNQGGESETILGNWLRKGGKRDRILIATKMGKEMGPGKKGLSRKYIQEAVEGSLRRLQTDYIDLYQAHDDDPGTPMEETLDAFAGLVKAGKVRTLGASNFQAARLETALELSRKNGLPRYESLQPLYNLYERKSYESELEPVCQAQQVGVICYYGLASGFLTGKYRSAVDLSKSTRGRGIGKYLNDRSFSILASLDRIGAKHGAAPATIALAWLMQRSSVTAPIASATDPKQLGELLKAADLTLDAADLEALHGASA
jgi:aryl-alcohol dehydrogenase-like predicted oxidoreductase